MPPPIRGGLGNGPSGFGLFHQQPGGFPNLHAAQTSLANAVANMAPAGQYMNGMQQLNNQLSAFSTANGNAFGVSGSGAGINGAGSGGAGGFGGVGIAADTGFGSQNARMSFQHGPLAQQHHAQGQHGMLADQQAMRQAGPRRIREVWAHNLHEEMTLIRDMVEKYDYIAMDTEFPGVVSRPMGRFRGKSDYHYQCLRTNVDLLRLIQIGLAFFDEGGNSPPQNPTAADLKNLSPTSRRLVSQNGGFPLAFQFNFKFDPEVDMYNEKSLGALRAAGIDFDALKRDGIDPQIFAALLIPSGLVCFDDVKWIAFHGGYDFGYVLKTLFNAPLPADESDFDEIMKRYFPAILDVKFLMKNAVRASVTNNLPAQHDPATLELIQKFEQKQGLDGLAGLLDIKRVGQPHTAGSDAYLTGKAFFQIRSKVFNDQIPKEHLGRVWGLGVPELGLLTSAMMSNGQTGPGAGGAGGAAEDGGASAGQGQETTTTTATTQNGAPSTPNTTTVPLATSTPAPQQSQSQQQQGSVHSTNGMPMGPMTPGGGGGVFGNFAFVGSSR